VPTKNYPFYLPVENHTSRFSSADLAVFSLVSGNFSLYKLHQVIQLAMGWRDSHLHQFIIEDEYYSIPAAKYWKPTPGGVLEDWAEAGVGMAIGIRAKIGQPGHVGVCSVIDHGAHLETGAYLGTYAYLSPASVVKGKVRAIIQKSCSVISFTPRDS